MSETVVENRKAFLLFPMGRVGRFLYILFSFIFAGIVVSIGKYTPYIVEGYIPASIQGIVILSAVGLALISFLLFIFITIKRLHDMNKSGFWVILVLLTPPFSYLILWFWPGTTGKNNFG